MIIQIFNIFFEILLPVFAVIAFAAYSNRYLKIDPKLLSKLNVYLFNPFMVLLSLSISDLQKGELFTITVMAVGSSVILILIGTGLAKLLKLSHETQIAFVMSIFLANTGGMGFSLTQFAFGDDGLQRAIFFFAVVQTICNPVAIFLASSGNGSTRESLKTVLKNPVVYASIIGILMYILNIKMPLPLERFSTILAQAVIPTALFLLGIQLSNIQLRKDLGKVFLASSIRLILAPLIGFGLAALIGISGLAYKASIMQISMPTGMFVTVYVTEFGGDAQFSAKVAFITTLGSILTLGGLIYYFSVI